MSWTRATPKREGAGFFHPDQQITAEFQDEFEVVPRPDKALRDSRLICTKENMFYIKSALPMSHVPHQSFFEDMANRQWQGAKPQPKPGAAPAFLNRMNPIGSKRDATGNQVADKSKPLLPKGGATDWNLIPELQRVNAYAFRGDKRHPRVVKAADGFKPPNTRNDNAYISVIAYKFTAYMKSRFNKDVNQQEVEQYIRGKGPIGKAFTEYEIWRAILKGEEMHIGRMVKDEFMKGYVSTSRDINTAATFAQIASADGRKDPMTAVYALHVEGGFILPNAGHWKYDAHASKEEAEIAYPGSIPWSKVMGFRFQQTTDFNDPRTFGKHSQLVFLRRDFRMKDPQGAYQVLLHLGAAFF